MNRTAYDDHAAMTARAELRTAQIAALGKPAPVRAVRTVQRSLIARLLSLIL